MDRNPEDLTKNRKPPEFFRENPPGQEPLKIEDVIKILTPTILSDLPNSEAFKEGVRNGSCRSKQPGGCGGIKDPIQDGVDANSGKLDSLQATLQGLDLSLLGTINNKLGNQVNGGISGKLARISNAINQSPVISWLNLLVSLHNAGQLSTSIALTLGDTLSSALNTFVFKDSEGAPIDVNQVLGATAQDFVISIVGEAAWTTFKKELALYNTIYRSGANLYNTVREIGDTTATLARYGAELDAMQLNAMLDYKIVSEDAYPRVSENIQPYDSWTKKLNSLDDAANALQGITGEVSNLVQLKSELDENNRVFKESLANAEKVSKIANIPLEQAADSIKLESAAHLIEDDIITGIGDLE